MIEIRPPRSLLRPNSAWVWVLGCLRASWSRMWRGWNMWWRRDGWRIWDFLRKGVLCFSLWRSVIFWRTKELLTKWLTFVCTLIYFEIYYAQFQFSTWMISLLWKSSMSSDHLPRLCTSCAILMPCSLSSRNRPDGSSFIINSRHQLVFCVDRDWTSDFLFNH